MEIAIFVIVAVVLLVVAVAGSPTLRRQRDAGDAEARLQYDIDREFKRPPHEGDLL